MIIRTFDEFVVFENVKILGSVKMVTIDRDELSKIPYINASAFSEQFIVIMAFYGEDNKWRGWFIDGNKLRTLPIVDVVESEYVAKNIVARADIAIPFIDIMWRYLSFNEIAPIIQAISHHFHSMGGSLMKLNLFYEQKEMLSYIEAGKFACAELEYLIIKARTIFDLVQELVSKLWTRIEFIDKDMEMKRKRCKNLPNTFSKLVIDREKSRTAQEITEKWGLPISITTQYEKYTDFFIGLRETRNIIIHRYCIPEFVLVTEKGFCIKADSRSLSGISCRKIIYDENFISILPLFATIILTTINFCNDVAAGIIKTFALPELILPEYHVYVRGTIAKVMPKIQDLCNEGNPWHDKEMLKIIENHEK